MEARTDGWRVSSFWMVQDLEFKVEGLRVGFNGFSNPGTPGREGYMGNTKG